MTTMPWFGTGRSARGAPPPRGGVGRGRLAAGLLVVISLAATGCQSGLSGGCGPNPCGGGPCAYLKGLRERVFHHNRAADCCGPTMGGEAPLEIGGPAPAVIGPGPAVVPTLPAAPLETSPTELTPAPIEKIPSAIPGPANDTSPQGAKATPGRASYESIVPRNRIGSANLDRVPRSSDLSSEPTFRSARGGATPPREIPESLLDNLPPVPVEVPREWTRNELPAEAPPKATSAKPERPAPTATPDPLKAEDAIKAPPSVNVVPGIRRFSVLEPKLAAGSLPTATGLDWLVEKGYKTILDLRESQEVDPGFMSEVTKRGLRYVVFPTGLKQLNSDHLSRFNDELTNTGARPLYFCDEDGTRAGVLWYLRRMTVDRVEVQAASREAEEIGLHDAAFWKAASDYLETLKPAADPALPDPPKVPDAPPKPKAKEATSLTPAPPLTDLEPVAARDIARGEPESDAGNKAGPREMTGWRSYAALVVTSLGVPLAYWSRSALPSLRSLKRASLPAPARTTRSLPSRSGD